MKRIFGNFIYSLMVLLFMVFMVRMVVPDFYGWNVVCMVHPKFSYFITKKSIAHYSETVSINLANYEHHNMNL